MFINACSATRIGHGLLALGQSWKACSITCSKLDLLIFEKVM
jgi:hypothetical protein